MNNIKNNLFVYLLFILFFFFSNSAHAQQCNGPDLWGDSCKACLAPCYQIIGGVQTLVGRETCCGNYGERVCGCGGGGGGCLANCSGLRCGQSDGCGASCSNADTFNYGACSPSCGAGTQTTPCGNSRDCCTSQKPQAPTWPSLPNYAFTQPDGGSIIQTRSVIINWVFGGTGPACDSSWGYVCPASAPYSPPVNADSFTIKITGGISQTIANISSSTRSYTTGSIFTANTQYTVEICAENGFGESCSTLNSFTKQAYPDGTISGTIGEYDALGSLQCTTSGANGNIAITLIPQNATGITIPSSCPTVTSGTNPIKTTSYSCTVSFDNINYDPVPVQSYSVSANGYDTQLYSGYYCMTPPSCGTSNCTNTASLDVDANGGTTTIASRTIYFNLAGNSYYKLRNVNFAGRSNLLSRFPVSTLSYDADDTDTNYLIVGDSAASYPGVGLAVSNGQTLGYATVSRKGWQNTGYTAGSSPLNAARFLQYAQSRKTFVSISNPNLSEITKDGLYIWNGSGSLTISDPLPAASPLNSYNVVIVASGTNGTINVNTVQFNPSKSTALIADTINFSKDTTQITGIFSADTVNLSVDGTYNSIATTTPLKIIGNVSSTNNSINMTYRQRSENRRPSMFVKFDASAYVNLLPYLSTSIYEQTIQ